MSGPSARLASAFVASVRAEGLEPDPALRLLHGGLGDDEPGPVRRLGAPDELGPLHEQALSAGDRTARGAWYTPAWLAEALVAHALPDRPAVDRGTVLDPACGGGAFLLAAARRMRELGLPVSEAADRLRGIDLDPTAVAVSEAAVWWWTARLGEPVVLGERLSVGDALARERWGSHGAVVGNPPFLGQLKTATAVDGARRSTLRARFGDAVRPYTDPAWLFLVAGVESVVAGGRLVMVQPQSVLAARDAGAVRAAVDARAELVGVHVDDAGAFGPSSAVCAPVLRRRTGSGPAAPNDWTGGLADARGVPRVDLPARPVLGDLAQVHAGFRDEYYGLVDAVSEGGGGRPLVTAGAIDPFRLLARPQRFAGRRWDDPRVRPARTTGRAARWLEVQAGPKVLVASQTKVIEAVADPTGALVGSVPVLCVRPHDPARLWHVLAVLMAPVVSAWLLRRSAGTARSADACRPTSTLLSQVPLPVRAECWDAAAEVVRSVHAGGDELDAYQELADLAYGVEHPDVRRWWRTRRPR